MTLMKHRKKTEFRRRTRLSEMTHTNALCKHVLKNRLSNHFSQVKALIKRKKHVCMRIIFKMCFCDLAANMSHIEKPENDCIL